MSNRGTLTAEQLEAMKRVRDFSATFKEVTKPYERGEVPPEIRRLFESEEKRKKLFSSLYEGSSVAKLVRDMKDRDRLIEGPLAQARHLGLFDPGKDFRASLATIAVEHDRYKSLFQLPGASEFERLARDAVTAGAFVDKFLAAPGQAATVAAAMEGMKSPWLNLQHELRSVRAFGDLIGIGRSVTALAPFQTQLVEGLRPRLGDWRDPVTTRDEWKDPILRSGFYIERGFDSALTDFPHEAFAETVEAAGLGSPSRSVDDEEVDGLARSHAAFARLRDLERAIRRFIVRVMEAAFGATWMERQLPPGMLDRWIAKREKAAADGQIPEALIIYADFTEDKTIIERRDNWSSVFKPVFQRSEDIRESFQRMFPLRVATMHARLITSEDELLLLVESRRILLAIEH